MHRITVKMTTFGLICSFAQCIGESVHHWREWRRSMPSVSESTETLIVDLRIPTLSNPLQLPAWPLDSFRYPLFYVFLRFHGKNWVTGEYQTNRIVMTVAPPFYDLSGVYFIELLFSLLFRYYCVGENSVILARSIIITDNPWAILLEQSCGSLEGQASIFQVERGDNPTPAVPWIDINPRWTG